MLDRWAVGVVLIETAWFCHFQIYFNKTWWKVYIFLLNSCVKFDIKICMRRWNITKVTGRKGEGVTFLCWPGRCWWCRVVQLLSLSGSHPLPTAHYDVLQAAKFPSWQLRYVCFWCLDMTYLAMFQVLHCYYCLWMWHGYVFSCVCLCAHSSSEYLCQVHISRSLGQGQGHSICVPCLRVLWLWLKGSLVMSAVSYYRT